MSDFTLYFVRHGESVANLSDRNGDKRPDDADRLSELGWEQARGLGRRLEGEGLELIVASPMTRAQETAQGIAEVLGLPIETDEDLFEVRQSDAFYAVLARLRRHRHAALDADRGRATYAEPGAESFDDIVARVRRVMERLGEIAAERRIVAVSHHNFLHFFLGVTLLRRRLHAGDDARALPGGPRQHGDHDLRAGRPPRDGRRRPARAGS